MNEFKGYFNNTSSFEGKLDTAVIEIKPELEDIEITPKNEEQNFKSEKYGYNNVKVKAVEGEELNVIPSTEKQQYSGVYSNVVIEPIVSEEITLVPTTEEQIKEGLYNKVTVVGDENFIEENIKQGVSIFGKVGTLVPTSDDSNYDLSLVGTKVTVEATGAIAKGSTWVGVLNDNSIEAGLYSQNYSSGASYYSTDLSVGYSSSYSITTTTETINLWLWDNEKSTYEKVSVNVSSVAKNLTGTVGDTYISDDGTLMMFCKSGVMTALFLEIDKENKTATAFVENFENQVTTTNARPLLFDGKYVAVHCTKTSYEEAGIDFYEYDRETHSLNYINRAEYSSNTNFSNTLPTPKVGENEWVHAYSSSAILKFIFDGSNFSIIRGVTGGAVKTFSSNGQYYTRRVSGYSEGVYKLNTQDLTSTLVTTATFATNKTLYIDGTIANDGSTLYDITGGDFENWTILATASALSPTYTKFGWSSKKWITSAKIYSFPQGGNSQYLISPVTNMEIEAGKVYGIASKTLNVGDIGEAQLLFTT